MTEWDAKAYSERNALQKWLADSHLAQLHLDGTERVLDLGCGDGKVTAEIARRLTSGSALGVDPSTRMIAFAQAHFAKLEYPNLAFAVGDATALPYRGEFDLGRLVQCPALGARPGRCAARHPCCAQADRQGLSGVRAPRAAQGDRGPGRGDLRFGALGALLRRAHGPLRPPHARAVRAAGIRPRPARRAPRARA
jgi:SAM-dependent methyltransferase